MKPGIAAFRAMARQPVDRLVIVKDRVADANQVKGQLGNYVVRAYHASEHNGQAIAAFQRALRGAYSRDVVLQLQDRLGELFSCGCCGQSIAPLSSRTVAEVLDSADQLTAEGVIERLEKKSVESRLDTLRQVPQEIRAGVIAKIFQQRPELLAGISRFTDINLDYSGAGVSHGADLLRLLASPQLSLPTEEPGPIETAFHAYPTPILADLPDVIQGEPVAYGRTLVYEGNDGYFYAVKVRKPNEPVDEFQREARMQHALATVQPDLGLRSTYPEPVGIGGIVMTGDHIDKITIPIHGHTDATELEKPGQYDVFVYRTKSMDYFSYINRSTDVNGLQEMTRGLAAGAHDIFAASRQDWMYTQLIDLYHSSGHQTGERVVDGGGKSLLLVDYLRNQDASVHGMGSIKNIHGGTAYPNIRRSGLADVGDSAPLRALIKPLLVLQKLVKHGLIQEYGAMQASGRKNLDWDVLYAEDYEDKVKAVFGPLSQDKELMALLRSSVAGLPNEPNSQELAHALKAATVESSVWNSCNHLIDLARLDSPGEIAQAAKAAYLSEQMICFTLLCGTYFLKDDALRSDLAREARAFVDDGGDIVKTPTIDAMALSMEETFSAAMAGYLGVKQDSPKVRDALAGIADFNKLSMQFALFGTMTKDELSSGDAELPGRFDAQLRRLFGADTQVTWSSMHADAMRNIQKYQMSFEDNGLPKHLGLPGTQMPIKEFESLAYNLTTYLLATDVASTSGQAISGGTRAKSDAFATSFGKAFVNQAWYTDEQMFQVLSGRTLMLQDRHVLAPFSDLEDAGNNLTAQYLYHQFEEIRATNPDTTQHILLPYNLGNNHWVGVRLEIDFHNLDQVNPPPVRLNYMDSMRASPLHFDEPLEHIPPQLRQQLQQFLEMAGLQNKVQRVRSDHLIQHDNSSCGPFTVENLLRNDPQVDLGHLTPVLIRRRHRPFSASLGQVAAARDTEMRQKHKSGLVKALTVYLKDKALTPIQVKGMAEALGSGGAAGLAGFIDRADIQPEIQASLNRGFFGSEHPSAEPKLFTSEDPHLLAAHILSTIPGKDV